MYDTRNEKENTKNIVSTFIATLTGDDVYLFYHTTPAKR